MPLSALYLPTQPPVQWVTGILQRGHENDHSASPNGNAKNMWCDTSTPPYLPVSTLLPAHFKTALHGTVNTVSNLWYYTATHTLILCNSSTWVHPSAFLPYVDQEMWRVPLKGHTTGLRRISALVLMQDPWNQYKTSDTLLISLHLHTSYNKTLFKWLNTYDESRPCVSKNAAALWLKLV
jgi:hypothetical protein